MTMHNPDNERIKRRYFAYLKEARRQSEPTVDAVAKGFGSIRGRYQAPGFQGVSLRAGHRLQEAPGRAEGETVRGEVEQGDPECDACARQAVLPLARRAARLQVAPSVFRRGLFQSVRKDVRVATARRERVGPTLEQVKHVITMMPAESPIERRDRTLIAFTLLTGARDSAIASMKLKHVNLAAGCVEQDAREVQTKFSKTFTTYFFPVGDEICRIVAEWVAFLRRRCCGQ